MQAAKEKAAREREQKPATSRNWSFHKSEGRQGEIYSQTGNFSLTFLHYKTLCVSDPHRLYPQVLVSRLVETSRSVAGAFSGSSAGTKQHGRAILQAGWATCQLPGM